MAQLLALLNHQLFTFGSDHVTVAELAGFITGAVCVWLTVRAHVANFPIGIANAAFFLVLFATSHLFADSALQIVYIVLGFIGWWQWVYGGAARSRLRVTRASHTSLIVLVAFVIAATWVLTLVLGAAHDIAPFWDALTTALSLAAQWLLNFKKIANWLFWIIADVIYIPLYFVKHLNLTGVVYMLFLAMCVIGWVTWKRLYNADNATDEAAEGATADTAGDDVPEAITVAMP